MVSAIPSSNGLTSAHLLSWVSRRYVSLPITWLRRITSPCFFIGHDEPIKVLKRSILHFECARCGTDLGIVLKGQKFRSRKPTKTLRLIKLRRAG